MKPATPALPGTQAAPLQSDAAQAASLHELARAAIAAQTMSAGFAKPASAPAGAPVGTVASGRGAASRAPMSATTAEQLASAAQPAAAGDTQADKAAPAAVTAVAAAADGISSINLADAGGDSDDEDEVPDMVVLGGGQLRASIQLDAVVDDDDC